jgi:tetratricopeptide (TPR) repeat protein
VLVRAEGRVAGTAPLALRDEVQQMREHLSVAEELDRICWRKARWVEGKFDYASVDRDYAAVFRKRGLAEEGEDKERVAQRIRGSLIEGQLVAALDDWALATEDQARRRWLLAVARRADPGAWSDRFRDAAVWNQRKALERLAREAKVTQLAPHLLTALGLVLMRSGGDPVPLWKAAQARYPADFWLNFDLGNALMKARTEEATGYYRVALALRPDTPAVYNNLGTALYTKGQLDEAIQHFRQAITLDPRLVLVHGALGQALLRQGQFAQARESTRRCLDLLPPHHAFREGVTQQLKLCQRLLDLEDKLPAILQGKAKPADAADRIGLAQLCQQHKQLYTASARFYAEAFADQPTLAQDLRTQHRYNAACTAALAASGQGKDADKLDDKERQRLRQQALDWLRADLAAWTTVLDKGPPQARPFVQRTLQHWQKDPDLAGLRDKTALAKLPETERQSWQKLWTEVDQLVQKTASTKEGR